MATDETVPSAANVTDALPLPERPPARLQMTRTLFAAERRLRAAASSKAFGSVLADAEDAASVGAPFGGASVVDGVRGGSLVGATFGASLAGGSGVGVFFAVSEGSGGAFAGALAETATAAADDAGSGVDGVSDAAEASGAEVAAEVAVDEALDDAALEDAPASGVRRAKK